MSARDLGIMGLGVMGRNLALNAESKGFAVAGFDVDSQKTARVAAEVTGRNIWVTDSLSEFVQALEPPRRIWVMVPAGAPVDAVLSALRPYLTPEDIVIDGGNSHFKDTERRARDLEAAGLRFFGMGVSGGEEGALHGPCLMPGGQEESYRRLEPLLTKMAAQIPEGPCCAYIGPGGAGHYVKMVHNGIEYGIMQLICETYDILKEVVGLPVAQIRRIFTKWNKSDLNSFLLEITIVVLGKVDPETGQPLVEFVLDTAEQKGTGKWTAQEGLDLGVAVPTLTAAVVARILSAQKEERVAASRVLLPPPRVALRGRRRFLLQLEQAFRLVVLACYAQGFAMMRAASKEYNYNLKLSEIAQIWRGGCIIRSKMLQPIQAAFQSNSELKNLLVDPYFSGLVNEIGGSLREVVKAAAGAGVPCLAYATSLGYLDSYRRERLPANLLQSLRDYFGAHTYRRIDRDGVFHTEWDKP